jgi:hypothetical protein
MDAVATYGTQLVASAVGIPPRRLEGWIERQVLTPLVAASGKGTRARLSREDALRVAVIAEIQRLLGVNLRPGSIGAALGRDRTLLGHVDSLLRRATQDRGPRTWLAIRHDGRRLVVGGTTRPQELLETVPVILLIDATALWLRLRTKLG